MQPSSQSDDLHRLNTLLGDHGRTDDDAVITLDLALNLAVSIEFALDTALTEGDTDMARLLAEDFVKARGLAVELMRDLVSRGVDLVSTDAVLLVTPVPDKPVLRPLVGHARSWWKNL